MTEYEIILDLQEHIIQLQKQVEYLYKYLYERNHL